MTVAVAHKVSPSATRVLEEAGREAAFRDLTLTVIEVVESLDLDISEAHRQGLLDEAASVLGQAGIDVETTIHVAAGENVSEAILNAAAEVNATLLVIGARKRSPVGKFLLGSATQNIILDAEIPVLVVKTRD